MKLIRAFHIIGIIMAAVLISSCTQQVAKKHTVEWSYGVSVYNIAREDFTWYQEQALSGSGAAAFRLSSFYFYLDHNYVEGLFWEEIAAENGDPGAQSAMGHRFSEDDNPRKLERAGFWLERGKSIDRSKDNGDAIAAELLKVATMIILPHPEPASETEEKRNKVRSSGTPEQFLSEIEIKALEHLALRGATKPAIRLYRFHKHVRADSEESRYWARIAAQNGDIAGQHEYGTIMAHDSDIRSRKRAEYWLRRAAKQASLPTTELLGNSSQK